MQPRPLREQPGAFFAAQATEKATGGSEPEPNDLEAPQGRRGDRRRVRAHRRANDEARQRTVERSTACKPKPGWWKALASVWKRKRKGNGEGDERTDSMLSDVARRLSWGDEGTHVT